MSNQEQQQERTRLQGELKGYLATADTLRAQASAAGWTKESAANYEAVLGKADGIKTALTLLGREDELRDWAHSGQGAAVVPGYGMEYRPAGPSEGLPSGDAVIDLDRTTGEYVGRNASGERKASALKSPAYRAGFDAYIREQGLRAMGGGRYSMKGDAMKVLAEGTDTAGGLWVVPEFNATLIKKLPTMSVFNQSAFHVTVGTDRVSFPRVAYTTDDKYTSGVRYSWTGEAPGADISEATNPVAGRTEINIFTSTAALILTRAMLEDAQFDVIGLISQLLSEAFILGDEDTIANGDGVGKPQGFLSHPNATTASSSGGMYVASGQASALDWGIGANAGTKGLTGIESAIPPQYDAGSAWYMSKASLSAVRALVDGAGRPLWGAGDQYPNLQNGYQMQLLGHPIRMSQFMPAIGANTYPIAFGDMQAYFIADRVGVTVEVLRELRALRDEVVIYARKRWGGVLVRDWQLKLQKVATS